MDNRRRNGAIALVVLATAVTALIYTQLRPPAVEPTTAFAPALSADESVPPGDVLIEAPADIAMVPEDDAAEPEAEAAALDDDAVEPAEPAEDVAAAEPGEPDAAPAEAAEIAAEIATPEAETAATDDAAIADATDSVAEDAVVAEAVEDAAEAAETAAAAAAEDAAEPAESAVAAAQAPAPPAAEDAAPADTVEAAPPAVEEPVVAQESVAEETVIALVDPGVAVEEPAAAPQMAETVTLPETGVPTFDIVRVEPSGDTVIAGQAEPNATVEILDAGTVIATAEANAGGDWAIALETPLEPGTHDLAIQTTSPDEAIVMLSDQRVTVSVPEDGSGEVLVVLNEPGAPSTLIQVPPALEAEIAAAAEEVVEEPVVAEAVEEPAVAETMEEPAAAEMEVALAPELATPEAETPAAETGAEVAEAEAAPEESAAPEAMVAVVPVEEAPVSEAAPEALAEAESATEEEAVAEVIAEAVAEAVTEEVAEADAAIAEAEAVDEAIAEAETVAEAVAEADAVEQPAEVEIAAAPVVEEPPAPPPPPEPMVSVAAVEAEMDGALFVAGLAATGETVRVYLDDRYIGDAAPSPTGTWLVESNIDLPAGEYVVRVDQVAGDGTVIARSEVPFEREVEVAILRPAASAVAAVDGASLAGAMPELETVIIKRGDNLWRIARANWGRGIRWSVIYQANTDQIRNPNRIYPGQVFVVPKGDANWEN